MTQPPPQPLDYATPAPRQRRPFTSIRLTWTLSVITAVEIMIATFVMPHFEDVFKDFKTPLPAITMTHITFTRWLRTPPGWMLAATIPIGMPMLVAWLSYRNRPIELGHRRMRIFSRIVMAIAMLFVAVTIFATFMPMTALMDSLSKP